MVAGLFALMGVLSEVEFCIGGCPSGDSAIGATAVVLLGLGAALLVGGMCWTAYVSRGTIREALVRGGAATGAMAAAVLFVWMTLGADGFAAGLVLAVGAAGAIVVREPTRSARYLRIAAIVVLIVLTTVDDNLAWMLLALLVFPAICVADTFAVPTPRPDRER